MSHPSTSKPRSLVGNGEDGSARGVGIRPALLAQLPGSLFCSPGFIVGIIVVEFLYGLVLFGVMSTKRPDPVPSPVHETRAAIEAPPSAAPAVPAAPVSPPAADEKIPAVETAAAAKPDSPAPKEPAPAAEPAKSEPPSTPPVTASAPTPAPTPASATPAQPQPQPTTVAATTPKVPAPTEAVVPEGIPGLEPLGALIDPLNDCKLQREGKGVSLQIPATLHAFDPDRGVADAPRALTDVAGDFVAQVKISGTFRPGTAPLPNLPITFQGAGILVWQDMNNYIRLDRAAGYFGDRGMVHHVLVESRNDGRPGKGAMVPTRDGPTVIRLERRGGEFTCTYSSDGKTWLPVKKVSLTLPNKLGVGVSATNVAPRPFTPRIEDFTLSKPQGGRAG